MKFFSIQNNTTYFKNFNYLLCSSWLFGGNSRGFPDFHRSFELPNNDKFSIHIGISKGDSIGLILGLKSWINNAIMVVKFKH